MDCYKNDTIQIIKFCHENKDIYNLKSPCIS